MILLIIILLSGFSLAQAPFLELGEAAGINHHHHGFMYGAGVVAGDFDGDGLLDIFIPDGAQAPNRLYLNDGDLTFSERAYQRGIADPLSEGFGAVTADVDNDGDPDIYVLNHNGPNRLYLNDGGAGFTDVSATSRTDDPGPGTSGAFLDYDLDGRLDLYVLNRAAPAAGITCKLYRNTGNAVFDDVTLSAGVDYRGYALGVICFDYDDDGWTDIFIADEFQADMLYRNNGDGTFSNAAAVAGLKIGDAMGVDAGDYNSDGHLDFYVSNYLDDFLYRNNGDGTFTEVARESGMLNYGIGWGVSFFDCENDGDRDVYVVNGAMIYVAREIPNPLYRNSGDGAFINVETAYAVADTGDGRGGVCGDFNNDGYTDLFLVNSTRGQSKLYVNPGGTNHWLKVGLEGTISNRDGVGARIIVRAGDLVQYDEMIAGGSYASSHPLQLEFGLAGNSVVDSIIIRWPSGVEQRLFDIAADQAIVISESDALGITRSDFPIPQGVQLTQNLPNPFNASTVINIQLPAVSDVEVAIFNIAGQKIRHLATGRMAAGFHTLHWDGTNDAGRVQASGVYVCRLRAGNRMAVRKMIMLK